MKKSLKDISWQVDEPTYRQDSALSYSTLARFEREGFGALDKLFESVESPSLLLGSMVDTLLTDGEKAFSDAYYVSDIPTLKPSVEPIVKKVYELFHNSYTNINDILDSELMPIISEYKYQPNWRNETRCKSIKQEGAQYYQTMFMARGKTVVTQDMYNKVFACVRALKDSPLTGKYFSENNPFSDSEKFYQLKFKGKIEGIDYRCMADVIVVDHANKVVYPCDLKTSSHMEYEFPKSFLQWRYDIQSRLYWSLIRQNMDKDEYFKDFKLANYRFIVVNTIDEPNPLIWEFGQTQALGNITLGNKELRTPWAIGNELTYYLEEKPKVPKGISNIRTNSIEEWFGNNGQ